MTNTTLQGLIRNFADLNDPSVNALKDYLEENPHEVSKAIDLLAPWMDNSTVLDAKMQQVEFFVEVGDNDYMSLWEKFSHESQTRWGEYEIPKVHWLQEPEGRVLRIGYLVGMPVNISVVYARLNGHLVCFWEAISMVVHHDMCQKWFESRYRPTYDHGARLAYVNATNFHHCLQYCRGE